VSDKIEKKLPADIITLIDEEAGILNISRQDAIRNLISVLTSRRNKVDLEKLQAENVVLNKYLNLKNDEILYLRDELSSLNRNLSKLAENLLRKKEEETEFRTRIDAIMQETRTLSNEQQVMKGELQKKDNLLTPFNVLFFLAGLSIGMLLIYFFYTK
jgi:hypothetical protein